MSAASKCDACGVLFEARSCSPWVFISVDNYPYGTKTLDLCDKCQKKLEEFIHFEKTPVMKSCDQTVTAIKKLKGE